MELHVKDHRDEGRAVITVTGALDLASAPRLCLRLSQLRRAGMTDLVLDLSGLEFCDSMGLRALIGETRETRVAGGRLRVVAPRDGSAHRLFELTGAEDLLAMHA